MNAPQTITFGCRLNLHESELMRAQALSAGLTNAVIINTCAVTAEAERQAGQAIRKLRRERPDALILVTGCASHIDDNKYSSMVEVDHVIPNDQKLQPQVFSAWGKSLSPAPTPAEPVNRKEGDLQRAFVQIQNGCDHRCTFCIIPYGRGVSRSISAAVIIEKVREAASQNYREVVFTGVDIASYGRDLRDQPRLGQMMKEVFLAVPQMPRLRLSSLDPAAIDDDLWDLIAHEPRLMPHLHLSLQAGDDLILKRMKRRHSRRDVITLCQHARKLRPDIVFGADVITGFPTESDAMFQNTFDLVAQCNLTWLHVFPYSARTGTPAARMPQVNGSLRRERAERLRQLGEQAAGRYHQSLIGANFDVLVEKQGIGCTPQFAKLKLLDPAPLGEIVSVLGTASDNGQVAVRLAA